MKFLHKKKDSKPASATPQKARLDTDSFYSRHAGEAPLDEYSGSSGSTGGVRTHRTSQHSPARVRERSNRASSWAVAKLLLRTVLIVVLLVVGFVVLKLVLDRLAEPSDKEHKKWETNAAVMEKQTSPSVATPQDLVVSVGLIAQRLEQWEQMERHLREAEALNRRGINEDAVDRLSQALRIGPNNREALQLLVGIYMQKGLYAEAVPLCIRLLDQDSRSKDLQMNLLRALQASGQLEAGLVLADRMLLDQPNNLQVLSVAAASQFGLGNKEAALTLYERILEKNGKNIEALTSCATIYFEQGNYQKTVPYYLELVRLEPKSVYYRALACCYAQQNEAGKSVIFMGQAASLFGEGEVKPWLLDTMFNLIRETVEFRSFADRIVGVESRKAIEAMNQREVEKAMPLPAERLEFPKQPDLNAIRPRK